jgi:hypothetical protein
MRTNYQKETIVVGKRGSNFIFTDKPDAQIARGGQNVRLDNPSSLFDDVYHKRQQSLSDKVVKWGSDNKLPYRIIEWVINNPILLPLLQFKVDMAIGSGLRTYRIASYDNDQNEIIEPLTDPAFEEFKANNDLDTYFEGVFTDAYFLGNFFSELIATRGSFVEGYSKGIALLNHIDGTTVRPELPDNQRGSVKNYLINPDWNNEQKSLRVSVPAWNNFVIKKKSILHSKFYFPGNPYFGVSSWIGSSQQIEYLNDVPTFKKNLIKNAATPSWIVRIPSDYFRINYPDLADNPTKLAEKRNELADEIENFLQGPENAGKPLITYIWKDTNGRDVQMEIEPLKNEIPDNLFSADFDQMFQIVCSATQVPPSLASILVPGKLSSGSDILNSWNAYNARIDRHRQKVLKILYLIKQVNGWNPELQFGLKSKELKTLDQNKSGQQSTMPDNSTTQTPEDDAI